MGEVGHDSGERHAEHEAEQAYLRAARRALTAMVQRADRAVASSDVRVREEDSVESHIQRAHMVGRRRAVDVGDVNLCFGRIDEDPDVSARATTGMSAAATSRTTTGDPLVVDWRAPVAVPFYRATAADPFGLAAPSPVQLRRRRAARHLR